MPEQTPDPSSSPATAPQRPAELPRDYESTRLLLEAANAFAAATTTDELFGAFMHVCLRATSCTRASVSTIDRKHGELRVVVSCGEPALPVGASLPVDSMGADMERVLEGRCTVVVDYQDPAAQTSEAAKPAAIALGFINVLSVPLVVEGGAVGVIGIDMPFARREFSADQIAVVQAIAAEAGAALETIQLLARERETARLAGLLTTLDGLIHSSLDSDTIFERVVAGSAVAIGADAAVLERKTGDQWPITHAFGLPDSVVGGHLTGGEEASVSVAAHQAGAVLAIENVPAFPEVDLEEVAALGIASVLAVPLVSRGEPVGTLIWAYHEPTFFEAPLLEFAGALGATVALALENASLYDSQRNVAEILQESLLQLPQDVDCLEFSHAYRSATDGARVGGDFYDLFELEDGRVGVIVGDVAGHGVGAAVLTSQVKHSLRALLFSGESPAQAMAVVNRMLIASTPPELFVSVFCAVLDTTSRVLTFCNAGHVDGLLVALDASLKRLGATSPVVGVSTAVGFDELEVTFDRTATLFLYTDGVTEARAPSREMFGEPTLDSILSALATSTPAEMVEAVLARVEEFTAGKRSDDIALLALRARDSSCEES